MDWQETLERAIPHPPPAQPDPAALVADGKRLVRRRRLAVVAGTAAAVAAVIGIGAVVVPSRDSATPNPPIATRSTAEDWPPEVDIPLSDLAPVKYDFETGETTLQDGWTEVDRVGALTTSNSLAVEVTNGSKTVYAYFPDPGEVSFTDASRTTSKGFRAWVDGVSTNQPDIIWEAGRELSVGGIGWKVVREIPNPLDFDLPWESLGAVLERDGVEQWILLRGSRTTEGAVSQGMTGTYAVPGQSIDDWLAEAEESDRKDYRPDRTDFEGAMTDMVEFGSGSEVVPTEEGVEILDQAADPDVGASFSSGTSRTAAARITVDGEERYVLIQEKERGETGRPATWAFSYTLLPAPYAEDRRPLDLDEFAAMVKRRTPPGGEMWR